MNIPSLPTDNLYKFLAMSGLVLILGAATLFFVILRLEQDRTLSDAAQLDAEVAKNYERQINLIYRLSEKQGGSAFDSELRKEHASILLELSKMHGNRVQIFDRITRQRETNVKLTASVAPIVVGIGIALASLGFGKWKTLQKNQDRITVAEAEKAELELLKFKAENPGLAAQLNQTSNPNAKG